MAACVPQCHCVFAAQLTAPLLCEQILGGWLVSEADHTLTPLGTFLESVWIEVDKGASGTIVRLGLLYYAFMGLLAIFCTNAINILAGINGIEAGQVIVTLTSCVCGCVSHPRVSLGVQSLVIAFAVLFINLFEMRSGAELSHPHMFSVVLILPFIAATLALLRYNWCAHSPRRLTLRPPHFTLALCAHAYVMPQVPLASVCG